MNGMASPEHGGEVGTKVFDFCITDIQSEDLIQNLELFASVELLIVEISSIQDDGILKQGLNLPFDFQVGLHVVPSEIYRVMLLFERTGIYIFRFSQWE